MQRLLRFTRHTAVFQRMSATELRILAEEAPGIAERLGILADNLEAHAEEAQTLANRRKLEAFGQNERGYR
jgi:hypothetical protein